MGRRVLDREARLRRRVRVVVVVRRFHCREGWLGWGIGGCLFVSCEWGSSASGWDVGMGMAGWSGEREGGGEVEGQRR